MKRRIFAWSLIAALMLSCSACSGGNAEQSSPESSAAAPTVTLTWTNWASGEEAKVNAQIIKDFEEKNPGITVKDVSIPDEYDTKLAAMVASGQAPDVAGMESATLLYPMAEEGKLVNLLDLIKKDPDFDEKSLMPQLKYMKDPTFMAGYGLGTEIMTMFYNPTLFQKAGVSEPPASYADAWDWDTFVKNAKLLTIDQNGKNASQAGFDSKHIKQYGINLGQWWPIWGAFIASEGGNYLTDDGKKLALDSPEALDALQKLVDLIYVDHVCPTPASGQSLPGLSEAITTGKVAMNISGQWTNQDLMNDEVEYNVAALPKMGANARTMITAEAVSIFQGKHVDEAWKFYKFLFQPDSTLPLEQSGVWLPMVTSMYSSENLSKWITEKHPSNYADAIAKPVADGTALAPYTSYVVNFSKINDIVSPALDSAWSGKTSVKNALNAVLAKANAEVKGRRDK